VWAARRQYADQRYRLLDAGPETVALKFCTGEWQARSLRAEIDPILAIYQAIDDRSGVVRVFPPELDATPPYLVSELCAGGDLLNHIYEHGALPAAQALALLAAPLRALAQAHAAGIVHRDIKPANILVRADASTCLADFGLARFSVEKNILSIVRSQADASKSLGLGTAGTYNYMAPEINRGDVPANDIAGLKRGDVYALGITLAQLLAGDPTLEAGALPRAVKRALPPEVLELLETAIETNPRDRFADGGALLQAAVAIGPAGPTTSTAPAIAPARPALVAPTSAPARRDPYQEKHDAAWEAADTTDRSAFSPDRDKIAAWETYLRDWGHSPRSGEARQRLEERLHASRDAAFAEARERLKQYTLKLGERPGEQFTLTIARGVALPFRWCPPGSFLMGSPENEKGRTSDEGPQTKVTLTKGFWIGETPVTQEQYEAVTGQNPSNFKGDGALPVEAVSWDEALAFCKNLSSKLGKKFALPTEAQWEYACRAGTTTRFSFGNNDGDLDQYAWYSENSGSGTHPVGEKEANPWGLKDVHGNVWEWCADWYDSYPSGPRSDPTGATSGWGRVLRGGSWFMAPRNCRSAVRLNGAPTSRFNGDGGFRVLLAVH